MLKLLLALILLILTKTASLAAEPVPTGSEGVVELSSLGVVFGNIASVAATLAGFATMVMLVVGGFRYMLGRGDPKALDQARSTIFWAIAGLVFVIMSYLIIYYISGFVSIDLWIFCIPGPGATCGA